MSEVYLHTPADLPIVLVGNKSDLVDQRCVSSEQAAALAEKLNLSYIETSALNASNVEQAFTLLVTGIYEKKKPSLTESSMSSPDATAPTPTVEQNATPVSVPVTTVDQVDADKPIRPSHKEKSRSQKKSGCCVIS